MNEAPGDKPASEWLQLAKDVYESSTSYMDANYRKVFERNIALHKSQHPDGSKYKSAAYKSRSRLFRPKTRSVVRKNEAAASAAFFANVDVVTCEAENDADQMQVISAELMNELVNYRLTKTIPWFQTVMGAVQEAQVIGIVGSYQYWMYQEKPGQPVPLLDDVGQPLTNEKGETLAQEGPPEVVMDKPCIELMPVENYRFDPASDWTDVVASSPYFIRIVPMYVDDVKLKMKEADPKTGQAKWKKLDDGEIRTAIAAYDTTRQSRESPKQDPLGERENPLKDYEMVFCHENFVRKAGKEVVYWTLGTEHMLTEPVPLKEVYFHGERPFVIGCAVIEAHKALPDSLVGIGSELQKNANEISNQRIDNVSLVLNKRHLVKRGAQVDTDSLLRNVPGGVTLVNDVETDVKEMNWPDVTASAYQEQDRINVDFDELVGNFSQSSVQTNRKLNETVGGMDLMAGGASAMTEYLLRTIVETWMEKVLTQLVKLEQAYETDQVILGLAGAKAKLAQKYGISQVSDSMLNQSLTVRVSMGMGATDPQKKLARFLGALKAGGEALQILPNADQEVIWNEIFGLAGYKGGSRFVKPGAANIAMQQQMQELQKQLQEATQAAQKAGADAMMAKIAAAQSKLDASTTQAKAEAMVRQAQLEKGVVQAKSDIAQAHGSVRETILKNQPPAQAEPVNIKPFIDKLQVQTDQKMLEKDKANAILQVQNAELQAELKLTKAQHGAEKTLISQQQGVVQEKHQTELKSKDVAMQHKDVQHTKEKETEVAKGVEKQVAAKPDHTADVLKEVKALVENLAKPRTKTATKDPKTGAWTVKES